MRNVRNQVERVLVTDNWPKRRRWMVTTLIWAMGNVQYLVVWGADTGLHQNALVALLTLIAAIIGSYIFGATWDDANKRQFAADNGFTEAPAVDTFDPTTNPPEGYAQS